MELRGMLFQALSLSGQQDQRGCQLRVRLVLPELLVRLVQLVLHQALQGQQALQVQRGHLLQAQQEHHQLLPDRQGQQEHREMSALKGQQVQPVPRQPYAGQLGRQAFKVMLALKVQQEPLHLLLAPQVLLGQLASKVRQVRQLRVLQVLHLMSQAQLVRRGLQGLRDQPERKDLKG